MSNIKKRDINYWENLIENIEVKFKAYFEYVNIKKYSKSNCKKCKKNKMINFKEEGFCFKEEEIPEVIFYWFQEFAPEYCFRNDEGAMIGTKNGKWFVRNLSCGCQGPFKEVTNNYEYNSLEEIKNDFWYKEYAEKYDNLIKIAKSKGYK